MCSELFRIPYEMGGVPIFGFGLLLAIWAAASALVLAKLVRRHGWSGETISSLPVLLMLGAAIVLLPKLFPEGMPIRGYGVMLLAGILAGVGMAVHRAKQVGLDTERLLSLAIWMVISGVIGARLFYVIEYWDESFAGRSLGETLLEIANIPEGGLVIYGGLVGGAVGFTMWARRYRWPLLATADLVAPSLLIGLALGRIGCLLNGCCYGGQTDWPWAVTFPQLSSRYDSSKPLAARRFTPPYADQASRGELHGFRIESGADGSVVVAWVEPGSAADEVGLKTDAVIDSIDGVKIASLAEARALLFDRFTSQRTMRLGLRGGQTIEIGPIAPPPRSRAVHPTQVYSAIDAALLGWLLWSYYPFRRRDGEVVALLLTIHPISRFLLEIIRVDEPPLLAGMSISQNISVVLLVGAAALWWYLWRQPAGVTDFASMAKGPPGAKPR
jgi:phosphatidylglycerol:prolipoprotein diacylglycerol transferase